MSKLVLLLLIVWVAISVATKDSPVWAVQSGTKATTLVGVGASSKDCAIGAASQNGKGLTPEVYNGLTWKSNVAMGGVGLDGAISSSGLAIVTTPFAIMISHDNGQTFNSTSNIYGPSQDVHILDNDVIAAVGAFSIGSSKEKVSGVIVSSDSGATWTGYNAGEYARYGAFPTATTWYVTSGIWSETVSTKNSQTYSLTKRRNVAVENVASDLDDDYSATGWFGKIFKTTDAGSTWTEVFTSLPTDTYYFNAISCISENHCVAVAEGENTDGNDTVYAFTTTDGGKTWTNVLYAVELGMTAVKMLSENEVWLGGVVVANKKPQGGFYYSSDGGLTFTLAQTLDDCEVFDIDFADGTGFASCISNSYGQIAMYK